MTISWKAWLAAQQISGKVAEKETQKKCEKFVIVEKSSEEIVVDVNKDS